MVRVGHGIKFTKFSTNLIPTSSLGMSYFHRPGHGQSIPFLSRTLRKPTFPTPLRILLAGVRRSSTIRGHGHDFRMHQITYQNHCFRIKCPSPCPTAGPTSMEPTDHAMRTSPEAMSCIADILGAAQTVRSCPYTRTRTHTHLSIKFRIAAHRDCAVGGGAGKDATLLPFLVAGS